MCRQRRHLFGQLKKLCKFDSFHVTINLASRSLAQSIPCLLNISLCFSASRVPLRVGGSSLLGQLPGLLSKLRNSLCSLMEKVHVIQQMYLFEKCTSLCKDESCFVIEAEQQSEMTRNFRKASIDSIPGSIIGCVPLGMLCNLPKPQFTFHKWGHQQYLLHKAVVKIFKCYDLSKGFSTVLDA